MVAIGFIQSYPYDAFFGGDGSYLQSVADYLARSGHAVHGLVSDITRGRTSPLYTSKYPIEQYGSWHVRKAVRLGVRRFLGLSGAQAARSAARAAGAADAASHWVGDGAEFPTREEVDWVLRRLDRIKPDAVILCYGAVHFAPCLGRTGVKVVALPGPLPWRGVKIAVGRTGLERLDERPAVLGDAERVDDAFLRSLTCVDLVGLTNDDEVGYWRRNQGTKTAVRVGMGFPSFKPMEGQEEPTVLFVGNATPQNCTAISWFLSYIWPEVRRRCPRARIRIVGRVCRTVRADIESGVECVGLVPDVEAEYARARIVVAPLVRGTAGVKVKVAEAISHGRPLVTTSVGVDAAAAGQLDAAAFVADRTTEFAEAVVALLTDEALYRAKVAGTRSVFQKCFSYEATYAEFLEWLTDQAAS